MLCLCLAFWAAASTLPRLSSHTVDLRKWGYTAPPKPVLKRGEYYPPSRLVTAYSNGNVVAGFVTKEEGLATREKPALALHAVAFDSQGRFLWQTTFPTAMRDDNSIFALRAEELLVRTPEALTLWSRERGVIAQIDISDPHTWLDVSPNREIVILGSPEQELQMLSARDLSRIKSCTYPRYTGISLSNRNIAVDFPQRYEQPYFHLRVDAICGPPQFEFGWNFPSGWPILLDDTRFIIHGTSTLELVDRDVIRWRFSLGKGESTGWPVEADERGDLLAVAVSKYVGGSVVLDINGHLKWMKIFIYRVADGKPTAELVVEHPPRFVLYFFALSPDGSVLAVLSDGFLQIAEIRP